MPDQYIYNVKPKVVRLRSANKYFKSNFFCPATYIWYMTNSPHHSLLQCRLRWIHVPVLGFFFS